MSLKAMYAGTCSRCHNPYPVGTEIEKRDKVWVHASCTVNASGSSPPLAVSPPAYGPYQRRRSRGARTWRPCGYPGCSPSYCDECDGEGR